MPETGRVYCAVRTASTIQQLRIRNIQITNKMHLNVYDVFYSLYSHPHVSAAIAAIIRVMLLQQYNGTDVISCVAVTT